MPLNLYRISQGVNGSYDTYDSAIVCAATPEDAQYMSPMTGERITFPIIRKGSIDSTWAHPDKVEVEYIGVAADHMVAGVVLSSYNAG